ncbi:MAG: hypothetical protein AB7I50_26430 [Vicinamibacterales bacterium]
MAGVLPEHRQHPDVSLSQHRLNRIAELTGVVLQRRRIYLDTRYWLFLRDAELGRPRKQVHVDLLDILRAGVQSGQLLCPAGDSTFFELLKQSDADTRLATARLIDTLSLGVVVQNAADRLRMELVRFLANAIKKQVVQGPPVDRVWMKVGHVLGTADPIVDGVSKPEQLAISKAFFDVMWSLTLEEMLLDTPQPHNVADDESRASATRITAACRAEDSTVNSFRALYLAEIRGFFDAHDQELCAALAEIHSATRPNQRPAGPEDFRSDSRLLVNAFTNLFRLGKLGTAVPTAQIVAGLHAAVRWQRQRAFRVEDFYDFYHATAALPYCDVFLTERFLGTLLTRPPLEFSDTFGTTVLWEEAEAVNLLRTLGSTATSASGIP